MGGPPTDSAIEECHDRSSSLRLLRRIGWPAPHLMPPLPALFEMRKARHHGGSDVCTVRRPRARSDGTPGQDAPMTTPRRWPTISEPQPPPPSDCATLICYRSDLRPTTTAFASVAEAVEAGRTTCGPRCIGVHDIVLIVGNQWRVRRVTRREPLPRAAPRPPVSRVPVAAGTAVAAPPPTAVAAESSGPRCRWGHGQYKARCKQCRRRRGREIRRTSTVNQEGNQHVSRPQ